MLSHSQVKENCYIWAAKAGMNHIEINNNDVIIIYLKDSFLGKNMLLELSLNM